MPDNQQLPRLTSQEIESLRPDYERPFPSKNPLSYQFEQEAESSDGGLAEVLTLFLTGSECRFRCLMCDLWKYTYSGRTPIGDIPAQVENGLEGALDALTSKDDSACLPNWIKLYNASNFFSPANVPDEDLPKIGKKLTRFERVIVENHPTILRDQIEQFRDAIGYAKLEVAMGLETVHPTTLQALNKGMNIDDFAHACDWLHTRQVDVRCFVLLRPPGMSESQGIHWCCKSIDFASKCGVRHISIIPVRSGNGSMEKLASQGHFDTPELTSLEEVLNQRLGQSPSSVLTVDLWDWEKLRGGCHVCRDRRKQRLHDANLRQQLPPMPPVTCACVNV